MRYILIVYIYILDLKIKIENLFPNKLKNRTEICFQNKYIYYCIN